jgi:cysteinyl-tRNA synthetase
MQGNAPHIRVGPGEEKIRELIAARAIAKKTKNYAEADRIRKDLLDAGIVLEDTAQGTTWRRA